MAGFSISVQTDAIDIQREQARIWSGTPQVGALVSFLGLMRDLNEGSPVTRMLLEHYPGMTERALSSILEEARARWALLGARIVHRVGELVPQDPIVLVVVASRHRGEAFQACEFLIDYLKTRAPFWKKEYTAQGARWVEARASDQQAEARWMSPPPFAYPLQPLRAEGDLLGEAMAGGARGEGPGPDP